MHIQYQCIKRDHYFYRALVTLLQSIVWLCRPFFIVVVVIQHSLNLLLVCAALRTSTSYGFPLCGFVYYGLCYCIPALPKTFLLCTSTLWTLVVCVSTLSSQSNASKCDNDFCLLWFLAMIIFCYYCCSTCTTLDGYYVISSLW